MTTRITLANSMRKKTAEKILLRRELQGVVHELRRRERIFTGHSLDNRLDAHDRERYEGIASASRWAAEDIERALKLTPTHDKLEPAKPQYPRYFRAFDGGHTFVVTSRAKGFAYTRDYRTGAVTRSDKDMGLDRMLRAMRDFDVEEITAETFNKLNLPPIPK